MRWPSEGTQNLEVRFGPKADIAILIDDFIRSGYQRHGNFNTKLGGVYR